MEMQNNNMGYGYGYDPNQQYGYYGQQPYTNQGYMWNNYKVPQFTNALTPEEIARIRQGGGIKLDMNVTPEENLRGICTHKENNRQVVMETRDGSGKVFCPICGETWDPVALSDEEYSDLVEQLIGQFQNDKWIGDLPIEMVREYYGIIPMLRKAKDIHKYAGKNFNKYWNQNAVYNANETGTYAQYNSLFNGANYAYNYGQPYYYGQQLGYYQQDPNQFMNQPQPGYVPNYAQQPMQQAPVQNPAVNPMQIPYGYGAPNPQMNPQFANQANMMMGGTMYQQPQAQYMPNQQPMQPQYAPVQPQAQQQPAQAEPQKTETTETKIKL